MENLEKERHIQENGKKVSVVDASVFETRDIYGVDGEEKKGKGREGERAFHEKKGRTNRRLRKDVDNNFVPTEDWGTEALLAVEDFSGSILEPACGDGAMARVLSDAGYHVIASDLIDRGYGEVGRDFFERTEKCDNIVTNPPYGSGRIADRFVIHALGLAQKKVVMLLRLSFLEGVWRRNHIFDRFPLSRVWIFSERLTLWWPDRRPDPDDKQSGGGTTAYAWFVWDMSEESPASSHPEIRFLPMGFKEQARLRKVEAQILQEDIEIGQMQLF